MIKANHLKEYVIEPTLKILEPYDLQMNTKGAVILLLATAAHESHLGTYLVQEGGPALGIYQIEPQTHNDVIYNYVVHRPRLAHIIDSLRAPYQKNNTTNNLISNLMYSTAIARIVYWRAPARMPEVDDIHGMARFWKQYYNTEYGKGTEQQFIDAYNNYIRGNVYN